MHPINDTKDVPKAEGNAQADNICNAIASVMLLGLIGVFAYIWFIGFVDRTETRMDKLVKENSLREKVLTITLTKLFPDDAETITRTFNVKALSQKCPEVFPAGYSPHQNRYSPNQGQGDGDGE